ncbi:Protein of unknown function [Actinacidiphila alni]|uniref:DUF3040 domain-containing protein n=1 Tax=Actinacidiphila alni TaxID=380248 RepID=A0A1I2LDF6_9ACTN|nr:DUF3040 domain-containing protein [Actinacidiphila alni]SFF77422.1 Protein of unknown function [Actinacidiphila alni]
MSTSLTERELRILSDIERGLAADRRLARALGVSPHPGRIWSTAVVALVLAVGTATAVVAAVGLHRPALFAAGTLTAMAAALALARSRRSGAPGPAR